MSDTSEIVLLKEMVQALRAKDGREQCFGHLFEDARGYIVYLGDKISPEDIKKCCAMGKIILNMKVNPLSAPTADAIIREVTGVRITKLNDLHHFSFSQIANTLEKGIERVQSG